MPLASADLTSVDDQGLNRKAVRSGPAYYERLLADAGVSSERALVVDDSPQAIAWAAAVGARTVLVGSAPCPSANAVIGCLAELPDVLAVLEPAVG